MSFRPRHVLITQYRMKGCAGSEIATFELAEYLASIGVEATVVTGQVDSFWQTKFDSLPGVSVRLLSDPDLTADLEQSSIDLAWVKHNMIPEFLLRGWTGVTVFNHLGIFPPIEKPLFPNIEKSLADYVLFVAEEAKRTLVEQGFFEGYDDGVLGVLTNLAPDSFYVEEPRPQKELRKLLVVSNHLPEEVPPAIKVLSQSLEVTMVGQQLDLGAEQVLVDADLVHRHDAVMTIGKTVQYSLVAGVPVYC